MSDRIKRLKPAYLENRQKLNAEHQNEIHRPDGSINFAAAAKFLLEKTEKLEQELLSAEANARRSKILNLLYLIPCILCVIAGGILCWHGIAGWWVFLIVAIYCRGRIYD